MTRSSHVDHLRDEAIPHLLWRLSLPATVGMLVMASYNIVDTIFVGHFVGVGAIAGLAIAFPLQMLLMGVCQSFGVGGGVMVSLEIGKDRVAEAERYLGNVFFLTLVSGVIFSLVVALWLDPILNAFGATPTTLGYASEYVGAMVWGYLPFCGSVALNNLVRAEGNARVAMATMLISAGLNIALDALFIWWLDWGVAGAAWATVLANWASFLWLLVYFLSKRSYVRLRARAILPRWEPIRRITVLGASVFARNAASSLMTILINHVLNRFGTDLHLALYGIYYRLMMFMFMPLFGLVQGLQPIVGYHEGAGNPCKTREAIRLATWLATAMATAAFLILWVFPAQLIMVFSTSPELVSEGTTVLRMASLGFPVVGYHVVGVTMFQAMGRAAPAFVLSMSRQVFFFIPLVLILPPFFGLWGVWAAFPLSDGLSFLITVALTEPQKRKIRHDCEELDLAARTM
jgi:putative MATE family efflux protein